ncbi:MAG: 5'-nucleotidase C-terminal domain-containing protein [Rhodothermales bacterium]
MSRLLTLIALLVLAGCRATQPGPAAPEALAIAEPVVTFTPIGDSLADDPAMEALVAPYRAQLQSKVNEVIGEATALFEKAQPEGPLGNLAADAMLADVQQWTSRPVDLALTNNGGLRVPINPGPITVGVIYELMPFDNMLSVVDLTGVMVDSLAQQLARMGGEPIAGFTFAIRDRAATDIRVAGAPLDPARTYRLVTSDYLANGGGDMPALWSPAGREDLGVLLRDSYIRYIKDKGTIRPSKDGRVSQIAN